MFPLNHLPPTLLTWMSKFSNAMKVCKLVRSQLLAGVDSALAFVLSRRPSLDLNDIARADGDVSRCIPLVKDPASVIAARLEIS
jgi:hypothetical protein